MVLALIIALPFIGVILPIFTERLGRLTCALTTALGPLLALVLLLGERGRGFAGETLVFNQPWLSELGFNLSLRLDGLGFLFALLILGIGLLVILYAHYYLSTREAAGRFYAFLLLFMGAMLGVVLAENLLLMMVFWELTSLSSFLLIGFWSHRSDARKGARMSLVITGGGGLALLAGILLIGHIVGSFELTDVLASGELIRAHALYPLALILVLLGVFTKSAQFPFHFWLPQAMAAPTPVSAYLHSATMVKAGVFLLARLYPALADSDWWFYLVSLTGLTTLLVGAILALFQNDLKGLLAYSTISHLGLITLLFGLDSPLSNVAAVFHIINHATFKASLFMAAGIIDHETGTRDMRRINGLWRYMPHTAVLAMVASLAMAGVPLLNGFLSKEMFFGETLQQSLYGSFNWMVPALAVLASVFSVAYSLRFVHDVFFNGAPIDVP
jgi:multicomponent K+:H+ antiporter subunit A